MKATRNAPDPFAPSDKRYAHRRNKYEIRAILDEAKRQPCARCQQTFPICCMQFDHLPGRTKRFNLSEARSGLIPRRVVLQELKKCEVVCANCHAIREEERRQRAA